MQSVLAVDQLPAGPAAAARHFFAEHCADVQRAFDRGADALAIVLPSAPGDHDDWRRALARDLARAHAPGRVNVIGSSDPSGRDALIAYLGDAPGITGQYLAGHESRS